jgi:hypothetical protein
MPIPWRHRREVPKRGLPPLQECIALAVALEFEGGIDGICVAGSELIHLDGVVDDQLRGLERVDLLRIAAQHLHGIAHRGQVDHRRHAGEVLHQDASRHPGDLARRLGLRVPLREELDIVGGDGLAVLIAKEVLEQDAQAEGKPGELDAAFFERAEAENLIRLAAGLQFGLAAKAVHDGSFHGERRKPTRRAKPPGTPGHVQRRGKSGSNCQTEVCRPRSGRPRR